MSDQASLSPEHAAYIDRACDAFEAAWKAGQQPNIKPLLDQAPAPVRPVLLRELLAIEVAYRKRRGDLPILEEWLGRLPHYPVPPAETPAAESDLVDELPTTSTGERTAPTEPGGRLSARRKDPARHRRREVAGRP
jgi:hypothetical protein